MNLVEPVSVMDLSARTQQFASIDWIDSSHSPQWCAGRDRGAPTASVFGNGPDCTWADTTKIHTEFGRTPNVTFEEGIVRVLENINF